MPFLYIISDQTKPLDGHPQFKINFSKMFFSFEYRTSLGRFLTLDWTWDSSAQYTPQCTDDICCSFKNSMHGMQREWPDLSGC